MKLFDKKNKKAKVGQDLKNTEEAKTSANVEEQLVSAEVAFSGNQGVDAHRILRSFYVSEKASTGMSVNQYIFKVFERANKSEVKKEVSKLFNVKVKQVKMLNMPEKRRDLGKHPGFKSGFKKAIVVLEEGYTIGQAKP